MVTKINMRGFTIVELLIVIVVIAILAAITVIAFNGIQQRSQSAQTVSALNSWIKTLNRYKVENGSYPGSWVCLGTGYKYGPQGTAETGTAQCRQDPTGGAFTENASFNNTMRPYTGGSFPTPAMITAATADDNWRRGLMFAPTGGDGTQSYIIATFSGLGQCPQVSMTRSVGRSPRGSNIECIYTLGYTTDPI